MVPVIDDSEYTYVTGHIAAALIVRPPLVVCLPVIRSARSCRWVGEGAVGERETLWWAKKIKVACSPYLLIYCTGGPTTIVLQPFPEYDLAITSPC